MKKLLFTIVLIFLFGITILKAQDCINYEPGQTGIGTLSETFGVSLADD